VQPIIGRLASGRGKIAQGRQETGQCLARSCICHQQSVPPLPRLFEHIALVPTHAPSARVEPALNLRRDAGGGFSRRCGFAHPP